MKINGRPVTRRSILVFATPLNCQKLHIYEEIYAAPLQTLHLTCPPSLTCLCFPGYGGSSGPCWHHRPRRSSCMYLISHPICQAFLRYISLLWGSYGVILCLLSLHQGPQGDKGSRGETVRDTVLINSLPSVL